MVAINLRSVSEVGDKKKLMVRVGGGYTEMETFVEEYGRQECFRIWHEMEKFNMTFEEVVIKNLEKNKASKQVITNFRDNVKDSDYSMFTQIMLAIRINQAKKAVIE